MLVRVRVSSQTVLGNIIVIEDGLQQEYLEQCE